MGRRKKAFVDRAQDSTPMASFDIDSMLRRAKELLPQPPSHTKVKLWGTTLGHLYYLPLYHLPLYHLCLPP